ncbi:hypothetical protein OG483_00600 [[Kitasatospora] papulosa]|uniref:hypothetical protein n=1 Tax=[Kitasatospora] papulosa TaxID=1464011 RepID=UPI002E12C746|nr:hypothetical protein OG483_00600 [[Kitasatospora] papulosa]
MSERRRPVSSEPEVQRTSARTVLMAAVLTGVSAVVVSLITGLGSSLQGLVADTLFGEDKPAATARPVSKASSAVAVAVLPGESSAFLVSGRRVSEADRAVLTGPYDQAALGRLFRKVGAVSLIKTAYKLSVTNTSSSPVTVVDIVPVITRRTPALDATMIEPLGGVAEDTIPAELDLGERNPGFTQEGKPYFTGKSQVLEPGDGFVMAVESKLLSKEYVEYHLRVDYIDGKGKKQSLQVNEDPDVVHPVFRVSGPIDDDAEYTDHWRPAESGRAWTLTAPAGD